VSNSYARVLLVWVVESGASTFVHRLLIITLAFVRLRVYCTISTDRSHLVMRDAHSSLTLMFTTSGDAWLNDFFDQIVHKIGAKGPNCFLYLQSQFWGCSQVLVMCDESQIGSVHEALWCVMWTIGRNGTVILTEPPFGENSHLRLRGTLVSGRELTGVVIFHDWGFEGDGLEVSPGWSFTKLAGPNRNRALHSRVNAESHDLPPKLGDYVNRLPHSSRTVGHSNKQNNNFGKENTHNRFVLHCF